jgi:hypothetical protein
VKNCGFAAFACAFTLAAQQSSVRNTTSVDVNGNSVAEGTEITQTKSANGSVTTETRQSINGRSVPLERVEERVVRDDASGKVTERVIHRYDPQGNPTPPIKETIEERKQSDGGTTVQSTTARGDINGSMQVVERTTTESHPSGSGETSQTVVERPTADGLRPVEKREEVVVKQGKQYQSDATTYRADGNGGFYPAVRETTVHTEQNSQASDNTAEYESGPNGQLQLHSQTVTQTVTRPDGSKDSVVAIYGRSVPGTVSGNESGLKLQEQQTIETAPGPNNTVVQTLRVRRTSIADPSTLGPSRQISQTVCKGDCKPKKETTEPRP